ncbi:hypothetical protein [Paenarthrobacter sp. DKR-5]|uniref:hypothetical protein n=1 Tax=Paenarthrobacter sp. DKR-5 TaxID=2835535 RepID=UPI0020291139|nr:hypothetical protein [Paenarthrobacter sp. DKR-5]
MEAHMRRGVPRSRAVPALLSAVGAALLLAACSSPQASPSASASSSQAAGPSGTQSSSASFAPSPLPTPSDNPSASAVVGNMVTGFPKTLLPVFTGAKVLATSVDRTGTPATASLVASTPATPESIISFYTKALTDQGFKALAGNEVGSTPSKDFVRNDGKETVNLSVVRVGSTSTFTIGANVAPESLK